jgi:hypothetical protein
LIAYASVIALLGLPSCPKEESVNWVRFNADDSLEVEVVAGDAVGDPVSTVLHSTTGTVEIGTATVDPGSAPVGTDHEVTVLVDDAWIDEVGKVTVVTDAGDRGTETHDMIQDSADHGLWWRILTSQGDEGETRTDTFTFELYSADGTTTAADTDGG